MHFDFFNLDNFLCFFFWGGYECFAGINLNYKILVGGGGIVRWSG